MRTVLIVVGVLLLAAAGAVFGVRALLGSGSGAPLAAEALETQYGAASDRYVTADGVRFRVREDGPADAPTIVLIHGFSHSLETWEAWADGLADAWRVIRFDLPGHGLTGPDPQGRYTNEQTVDLVAALVDELALERFALAGNSLGGLVAWRYAAAYPQNVSALVLIAPGGYPNRGVGDEPAPVPALVQGYLRTAPAIGVETATRGLFGDPERMDPAAPARVRDLMRREGNGAALLARVEVFTLPDPEPALRDMTTPTLILWGARDTVVPVEHAERFAAAIPGARAKVYDDLGHIPQEEAPDQTLVDARAFLAAVETGDAAAAESEADALVEAE